MQKINPDSVTLIGVKAAVSAGKVIMEYYNTSYTVEYKDDNSPLTNADKSAHQCIFDFLAPTDIPVLSEEGIDIDFLIRKQWNYLWMVDPLDGTKEFISGNGEFTVNIALIESGMTIMGIVYVPVSGILYFGSETIGSWRLSTKVVDVHSFEALDNLLLHAEKLPLKIKRNITIMGSRSHQSPENLSMINSFANKLSQVKIINAGSSLKFCRLAEGNADFYPRLSPTMEWDTAAGHAVAKFAGIKVFASQSLNELVYNKPDLLNPWFIAIHPDFEAYL